MLGELFSINSTNIGRAALRDVPIAVDSPADAVLVPLSNSGDNKVGVLVTGAAGFRRVIPISEARVRACIGTTGMDTAHRYVDELATAVRSALGEALQ